MIFIKLIHTNTVTPITLTSSGTTITGRHGHKMVAIGTDIYIYGGSDNSGDYLNDFYKINTSTNFVKKITLTGTGTDTISRRYGHSMVAIESNIYIFGGQDSSGKLNDFYKIDTTTNIVEEINLTGTIPERYLHSMVAIESNIYIFGGIDGSTYYNDFYKIDISTNSVTPIDITMVCSAKIYIIQW